MKSDNEVRRLRRELAKTDGNISMSAKKTGMDRKTARKYKNGELPSERQRKSGNERSWKTRISPFEEAHEEELHKMFLQNPSIQATTLLDYLQEKYPKSGYENGLLRTLQRRVEKWRKEREKYRAAQFAQEWHPGKVMQLDWTWMNELEIRINGEIFEHRLCHGIFPHSNWSWGTICHSESLLSLKEGLQEICWQAGGLPHALQTDNSSAATHRLGKEDAVESGKKRDFNSKYKSFLGELGIEPQTIPVRCSNANADIETRNGHLKRYIAQRLILRGYRDFNDRMDYRNFLEDCFRGMNRKSGLSRFEAEEKPLLQPLPPEKLPVYDLETLTVSSESLIHIEKNTYSVPNKLIGEILQLEVYEDRLEVYKTGKGKLFTVPKLHGKGKARIDFRHLIDPLLRKIGAFRNYRYHSHFFPGSQFRSCYDFLCSKKSERQADRTYLEILKLAADYGVIKIDACLQDILSEKITPTREELKIRLQLPGVTDYEDIRLEAAMDEYDCFDRSCGGA